MKSELILSCLYIHALLKAAEAVVAPVVVLQNQVSIVWQLISAQLQCALP